MAIDSRYIPLSYLQEYVVDKDSGLPLANGTIEFFKDQDRLVEKDVFVISGDPPNYIYTNIGSVVTLSGVGTTSYQNNDVTVYLFPYDEDGNVENYYLRVRAEGESINQFTREGVPNLSSSGNTEDTKIINFIPNGQFLIHNNLPETPDYEAGEVREPITEIAQGGFTFERPDTSAATDIVTFQRYGSFITNPTGNPRYALRVRTTVPFAGDTFKDIRIKFNDVNKFCSEDEQLYTFSISGQSNTGGDLSAALVLIKNYGTGGDTEDEIPIANLTFTTNDTIQNIMFSFGDNDGKSIGDDNDDFVQLAVRLQTNVANDLEVTDWVLTPGQVNITQFPPTTNVEMISQSMAGEIEVPDYDGYDLYLPVVIGKNGLQTDRSVIGDVIYESQLSEYVSSLHPSTNRMLADGTKYLVIDYSDLGIPFRRLFDKYWNSTSKIPQYGTGADFFSAIFPGTGNEMRIVNNTAGSVTNAADVSTTFTITTIKTGATTYYARAFLTAASTFYIESLNVGAVTEAYDEDTGFTLTNLRPSDEDKIWAFGEGAVLPNGSAISPAVTSVTTVAESSLANPGNPGKYFVFYTYNSGIQSFYVWYQITNETDPAPMGISTGIKVILTSGDSAATVAEKTREAINGWQMTKILTVAASAIPAGAYFTINSTGAGYYVWYKKNGAGTDPAVSGRTGILVEIASSDTNTQVAEKTRVAINSYSFASPDYRGMIPRVWANGSSNDLDRATRWSMVPGIIGDVIGTSQLDGNLYHIHTPQFLEEHEGSLVPGRFDIKTDPVASGVPDNFVEGGNQNGNEMTTKGSGNSQARPLNIYVNAAIIY
jgi:hypothetical protein